MATLKVRVLLNKGRRGVPLHKLARINREAEKFLSSLGMDLRIISAAKEWLAVGFAETGSVLYDIEHATVSDEGDIGLFNHALGRIARLRREATGDELGELGDVSPDTIRQYTKIAEALDPDEEIGWGIYGNGTSDSIAWDALSAKRAEEIQALLGETMSYYGSMQGTISALTKDERRNDRFFIRPLASGERIKCSFERSLYDQVVALLQDREQVVFVSGQMTITRVGRKVTEIAVDKVVPAPEYKEGDLEHFFGCAPDLTGDLSTQEFVAKIRARTN